MISKVPLFLHQRAAPTYSTPTRPADKADRNKKMTDSNSAAAKHSGAVARGRTDQQYRKSWLSLWTTEKSRETAPGKTRQH